jgi:CheY-like chemotaxis protein
MIEKFGAQSEYAINGADAVDRIVTTLKTNPFDAILMDVQMPIMDGRSATRHLREIGVETPIIALTAHASKSEKNACIESGCSDFLPKPVSRELLQEVLLLHLSDSTETRNLHDPLPQTDKPIAMEDDEEFAAIKKKYVASLKTHSMNLRDATENKNVESIRQISHKIRGTASSYGFEQLSQLAETLELAILSAPEQLPSSSKILALIEALDEATQ